MYYNRLLFSIYTEKDSSPVYTTNYAELIVLGKGIVTFDILVDGKPKVINFCNIFLALELEYNLLSVSTIRKLVNLFWQKKGK